MCNEFLKPYIFDFFVDKGIRSEEAKNKLIDDTINQHLFIVCYVPN